MTPISRLRAVTLGLVAGALLAGCATKRYAGSSVVSLPAGLQGRIGGRAASFELDGLKVRLEAAGQEAGPADSPRVSIAIRFDPRELGYSFDPAQVVVRDPDGHTWPAQVVGGYRPLAPGSSFGLSFAVEAARESRLTLVIDGLARGARRLDPVELPIGPRRWSTIERVYWLEAIGYVLSAAAYAR